MNPRRFATFKLQIFGLFRIIKSIVRLIKFDLIILWTLKPIFHQHTILLFRIFANIQNVWNICKDELVTSFRVIFTLTPVITLYSFCDDNFLHNLNAVSCVF